MLFRSFRALCLLGLAAFTVGNVQESYPFKSYDDGLFTPLEDFSSLSTTDFTSLRHPLFPDYSVRIKKSNFCDGTVR